MRRKKNPVGLIGKINKLGKEAKLIMANLAELDAKIQAVLDGLTALSAKIDTIPAGTAVDVSPQIAALDQAVTLTADMSAKVDKLITPVP